MSAIANPSMTDLRVMAGRVDAPAEPKSETTETEEQSEEQNTETEPGTVSEEPQEEEFELPKNVQKKISQEAKKAAFFQSKIDQATSLRKAKEAEAAKLNGKSGSEPGSSAERTTEPAKDADPEPEEPDFATFNGTGLEFQQALKEFKVKLRGWNARQNEALVESKLAEREMTILRKQAWDKAVVEHGEEFPKLMDALRDATTEPFQKAVSLLDHWDMVAVHLATGIAFLVNADQYFDIRVYILKVIPLIGMLPYSRQRFCSYVLPVNNMQYCLLYFWMFGKISANQFAIPFPIV